MYRARFHAVAYSVALLSSVLCGMQVQAGQVIAAAGTLISNNSQNVPVDRVSTTAGGAVSYSDANFTARAMTDFGINRIYNQANTVQDAGASYASSAWAQTFTAEGTGTVNLKFNFTIDGSVDYGSATFLRSFNYLVTALKGDWSLSSQFGNDDLTATRPMQTMEQAFGGQRTFAGTQSVALNEPSNGFNYHAATADGNYEINRNVNKTGDNIYIESFVSNLAAGQNQFSQILQTPTYLQQTPGGTIYYNPGPSAPPPLITAAAAASAAYQNNINNFPILAQQALCSVYSPTLTYDGCAPGIYEPTTLTLEFNLQAGTTFTIISALMSETAENGTVDFYNTVRLRDIVATGGTVTSDNAQFVPLGDGTFGFASAAEVANVPEPATWGMMILGFGGVGGALRRNRRMAVSFG